MKYMLTAIVFSLSLQMIDVSIAAAHVLPWRAGDTGWKGFGHCAKGPCMKRSDFGGSKPHHHHAGCVVMGSFVHSNFETCARRANANHTR